MIAITSDEDDRQLALLTAPTDVPGSGRVRYAAAMYFYQRGMIGAATLEVYRTCSPLDREDPRVTLNRLGLLEDVMIQGETGGRGRD